jgi:non-ribosomal peptide synthetase component F
VEVGETGELPIGGDGLALGYLDEPGLASERFVPGPPGPGRLLYCGWDLVRWTADGCLEFGGRADRQVKVSGCRVEPEEIEVVLRRHAAVMGVVVVPVGEGAGKRLVAYVAAR